jgi:biopolymer transport protein ExbD
MDIFTILVFFLMVNSTSDVQVLNQNEDIVLPISNAKKIPEDALAIAITSAEVLVAGRAVVRLSEVTQLTVDIVPNLKEELEYQASKTTPEFYEDERTVIIMADRGLRYDVLKKIMATCVDAGYRLISLAVRSDAASS